MLGYSLRIVSSSPQVLDWPRELGSKVRLFVTKPGLTPELRDCCLIPSSRAEHFQPRGGRNVWSGLDLRVYSDTSETRATWAATELVESLDLATHRGGCLYLPGPTQVPLPVTGLSQITSEGLKHKFRVLQNQHNFFAHWS